MHLTPERHPRRRKFLESLSHVAGYEHSAHTIFQRFFGRIISSTGSERRLFRTTANNVREARARFVSTHGGSWTEKRIGATKKRGIKLWRWTAQNKMAAFR